MRKKFKYQYTFQFTVNYYSEQRQYLIKVMANRSYDAERKAKDIIEDMSRFDCTIPKGSTGHMSDNTKLVLKQVTEL